MRDEFEFDLRKYIAAIFHAWKWLAGAAILAAIIAFAFSFLQPKVYKATVVTVVTAPTYIANFDPRIETVNALTPIKSYLDLATSDELVLSVYNNWQQPSDSQISFYEFQNKAIKVQVGSDPSILKLSITLQEAEVAASLANLWAQSLVDRLNQVYGVADENQVKFFEVQVEQAKEQMDGFEQSIIDFEAENRTEIIKNRLNDALQEQADLLTSQRNLSNIQQSILDLKAQLSNQPSGQLTPADQMSVILLQSQLYNMGITGIQITENRSVNLRSPTTLQLDLNYLDSALNINTKDQITILENIRAIAGNRSSKITDQLKNLEQKILDLKQQLEEMSYQKDQLDTQYLVAKQTYVTLSHKYDESRISSQMIVGKMAVFSNASAPNRPLSHNTANNSLVAGFLGFFVCAFIVLFRVWWKEPGLRG